MAFSETWDEDAPDGAIITISALDNFIRSTRVAIRERMEGDPADPLTGIIEEGTWELRPILKAGVSRFAAVEESEVAGLDVQYGRGAFTTDDSDGHPKLYHLHEDGAVEIAYVNRDGSRPMVGTLAIEVEQTGNISSKACLTAELTTVAGAVTIGEAIGVLVKSMTKEAGVAFDAQYGIKIEDMNDADDAADSYSIYAGAGKVRFGGHMDLVSGVSETGLTVQNGAGDPRITLKSNTPGTAIIEMSGLALQISTEGAITFWPGQSAPGAEETCLLLDVQGNVLAGLSGVLPTNSTDGFLYIPRMHGNPTRTPTMYDGFVPIVYDTINGGIWVYSTQFGWEMCDSD